MKSVRMPKRIYGELSKYVNVSGTPNTTESKI